MADDNDDIVYSEPSAEPIAQMSGESSDGIVYFGPPDGQGVQMAEEPPPVGFAPVPEEVLVRHNARVLDPKTAPALRGYPAPSFTIYRADDLLFSGRLSDATLKKFREVLQRNAGLTLGDVTGNEYFTRAVLVPAENSARPAVVDAWLALQTLRAAPFDSTLPEKDKPAEEELAGIGLNHQFIGAAMGGIGGSSGALYGVPGAVNGGPYAPGGTDDLGYWRRPVVLTMPRQPRRTDTEVVGRRPMIAVLDTGTAPNTRLDEWAADTTNFVLVDKALQLAVDGQSRPGEAPGGYEDQPYTTEPLVGDLSWYHGHGTFINGLVQQIEPDATILSIRVMHNDGFASSGVVSFALRELLKRVEVAQGSRATKEQKAQMVDIVSLSLGNFIQGDFGPTELAVFTEAIDDLRARGVIIVASAGNYASSRKFYPAALAERPVVAEKEGPQVISVGALNPNGTKALFSNDSDTWVTCWAPGASLVSTYPQNTNAARGPAIRLGLRTRPLTVPADSPLNFRESLEVDNYAAGLAAWSGTSFATPLAVGKLARLLFNDFKDKDTSLEQLDTIRRANRAIQLLRG